MQFNSSDVQIRRARSEDAQEIGAVFDAAVQAGWQYLGEQVEKPMFAPHDWDQLVADHAPPNALFVATDHTGHILGFTAVHPENGEMFLLFVHPAFAGHGVGRALLSVAHNALRASGCQQAFLFVHEQNQRARAVYEAVGYHSEGSTRESNFRGTIIREVRLVKAL